MLENSYKKFTLWFVGVIGALTISNATINYIIDPSGIFDKPNNFKNYKIKGGNDRYIKPQYLKTHHNEFNSYIFGSSRIGLTAPKELQKYIPNSKFYNAWVSSGNLLDAAIFLDYLIAKKYEVKNYYVQFGLDHSKNIVDYRIEKDLLRNWHPEIINGGGGDIISMLEFYATYLFTPQPQGVFFAIKVLMNKKNFDKLPAVYDLKNGNYFKVKVDIFNPPPPPIKDRNPKTKLEEQFFKQNLRTFDNALKSIKANCDTYKINCILVTEPHYVNIISQLGDDIEVFIRHIVEVFPKGFWCFSYYNSVTTNRSNYHESVHHISAINKLIFARIFNDKNVSIPKDFGIFITKDNLEESLNKIKEIEAKYKPSK